MNPVARAAQQHVLETYGLSKTAAPSLSPETHKKLQNLYMQHGAISGGIRGGLLGGFFGAANAEEGDRLSGALKGVGIGGLAGGALGAVHGHYLTRSPDFQPYYRRAVTSPDDGINSVSYYLKRPGQLTDERLAAKYLPGDRWHDILERVKPGHSDQVYDFSHFGKGVYDLMSGG
jgi:hypothetical protein